VDLFDGATDPQAIKAELPLEYAANRLGLTFNARGRALCPWHDDHDPSFRLWRGDDNVVLFACDPCGSAGDVYTFIQKMRNVGWRDSVAIAKELLADFEKVRHTWQPSVAASEESEPRSLDELSELHRLAVEAANVSKSRLLGRFLQAKRLTLPTTWLRDEWGWGEDPDRGAVVIPHMLPDRTVTGLKYRSAWNAARPYSEPGSKFETLYGVWRTDGSEKTVLVCEGETDAILASWQLRGEDIAVYALPRGAGADFLAEYTERLAARTVYLAFDGDRAGRDATRKWVHALGKVTGFDVYRDLKLCPVPEGRDVCDYGDVRALMAKARVLLPAEGGIVLDGNPTVWQRVRVRQQQGQQQVTLEPIANWGFEAEREVHVQDGDRGVVYEGTITTRPELGMQQLADGDMRTKSRMAAWANRRGLGWKGTDNDAQAMLQFLGARSPVLSPAEGTTISGLHGEAGRRTFVLPNGHIGPDPWVYVEPISRPGLDRKLHIVKGSWDRQALIELMRLHEDWGIVSPVLAWLAVAPLRSTVRQFPVLMVVGSAGTGKTTYLETVLGAFGYGSPLTLTSSTPYAVEALVGATNAFPLWVDEWRRGARTDTLLRFNQLMRDAYTGEESQKGGKLDNAQALSSTLPLAPIIVSGEDAPAETSHIERAIIVNMRAQGRSEAALRAIRELDTTGLGHAYLRWLLDEDEHHRPMRALDWGGPATIENPRVRYNIGILEAGWDRWLGFLETYGFDVDQLPALDWSHTTAETDEHVDPYLEAVLYGAESADVRKRPLVWVDADAVYIRVGELTRALERTDTLVLPSLSAKAFLKFLRNRGCNPVETRVVQFEDIGVRLKAWRIVREEAEAAGLGELWSSE
jgi:hypothetical protein